MPIRASHAAESTNGGPRVTETVDLRTQYLIARDDGGEGNPGDQLTVFGKATRPGPVLGALSEELPAIALPDPEAPLFRS